MSQNEIKKKPFFQEWLKFFRIGVLEVITHTEVPKPLAVLFLTIRLIFVHFAFINLENLNLAPNSLTIAKYIYYIQPYKIGLVFNTFQLALISIIGLLYNSIVLGGFFFIGKNHSMKSGFGYFGVFVYFYQFIGFYLLFPLFTNCIANNSFHEPLSYLFGVIFILLIIYFLTVFVIINLFFVNFLFKLKDSFCRSYDFVFVFIAFLQISILVIDSIHIKNELIIKVVFCTILFFSQFVRSWKRLCYTNPFMTTAEIFFSITNLWIWFLYVFSTVFTFDLIKSNFFILLGGGTVFLIYNFYIYRKFLVEYVTTFDSESTGNAIYFIKKILYLYFLKKESKTSKESEFLLASFVLKHIQDCNDLSCICKMRKLAYDPKKEKFSDLTVAIWKDGPFIKNLFFSLIKKYLKEQQHSIDVEFFFILFSMEVLENTIKCNLKIIEFRKKCKSIWQIPYRFSFNLINEKLTRIMNRKFQNFPFWQNKFEQISKYDTILNELK